MDYYGKTRENFNDHEKKLFKKDNNLFIVANAPEMIGPAKILIALMGGPSALIIERQIFVGTEILGMKEPETQEEFTAMEMAVEKSDYSLQKFMDNHQTAFEKFVEERKNEGGPLFDMSDD